MISLELIRVKFVCVCVEGAALLWHVWIEHPNAIFALLVITYSPVDKCWQTLQLLLCLLCFVFKLIELLLDLFWILIFFSPCVVLSSAKGLVASSSLPWLPAWCWCTTAALVTDHHHLPPHPPLLTVWLLLFQPQKDWREHRDTHIWRGTQVSWIIR